MNIISMMRDGLLNPCHDLYKILKTNAPIWWKALKEDKDLYIEIRKGNVIDVYYLGGRMAEIKCDRNKNLVVTAHPKYLGYMNEKDKRYYREGKRNGKAVYTPIYQDCSVWLLDRRDELKANIQKHYSGASEGENTSEKFIQGNLILNGRDKYLDSEFAHRLYDGKINTIRIDLVKIENGLVVFEELKRIRDSRLRNLDGNPEILDQIRNYREFIKVNKEVLTKYYRMLYQIKRDLDLPIPIVANIDNIEINTEPQLLIAQNYNKINKDREKRICDIENILDTINVKPNYC